MTDKEIILRGLENLKTKMNNASGGLFQRLENLEIKNGKLKQKNKKLKEQLLVSQTNEETFRLEMEEVTKMLGLDEDTIFDDVKAYVRSLKDNWTELRKQEIKKQLEDMTLCRDIASGHRQEVQDREVILLTQQKEFINFLEDEIERKRLNATCMFEYNDTVLPLKVILQKYKEIIGVSDENNKQ